MTAATAAFTDDVRNFSSENIIVRSDNHRWLDLSVKTNAEFMLIAGSERFKYCTQGFGCTFYNTGGDLKLGDSVYKVITIRDGI